MANRRSLHLARTRSPAAATPRLVAVHRNNLDSCHCYNPAHNILGWREASKAVRQRHSHCIAGVERQYTALVRDLVGAHPPPILFLAMVVGLDGGDVELLCS